MDRRILKSALPRLGAALVWLGAAAPALGQYDTNLVGYAVRRVYAGDNLIVYQFSDPRGNTLDRMLNFGSQPLLDGSTFTLWDPVANQFLPPSVWDSQSGWSINYELELGMGAVLHCPTQGYATVVGSLDLYWTPPERDPGLHLIGDGSPMVASFQDVVGRDPQEGEWVRTLIESNQTYRVTTFQDRLGWDNGAPRLLLTEAGWFYLTAPRLSLAPTATNSLILSWPIGFSTYQLEENSSLSAQDWTSVTSTPQQVGLRMQAVLWPRPVPQRFYRLHKQSL